VLLLGVMNGLALVVKDLGALAAFSGALAGSAIIYIFPAAMFLKSAALQRAKGTDATSGAPRYQTREVVANWLMAGLGVLLAIVGGTVSAKAL
jgi:sodium-coupled neutral amino acid transporter 11